MGARGASAIGAAAAGTGAVLTATVASACCVGPALAPIFLSVLGASGLAAVAGLRPYSPWILLLSALLLGFSFRQVYLQKPLCAADGSKLPVGRNMRRARFITWAAAALWGLSSAYAIYGLLHE